ncbi:MAG: glycosyltransferase, partial [Planctomycetales bacterium]
GSSYLAVQETELPAQTEAFLERKDPVIFTYVFLREGFYLETLVEGMQRLAAKYPNIGLVTAGSLDDNEPAVKTRVMEKIKSAGIRDHFCFAGDLTHDQFVTALRRSKLYLRTPTSDGECTSVLESLTEKVPVVAAENNNRPPGVVTYQADDPDEMCRRVCEVLSDHQKYCDVITVPKANDTVAETAEVLIAAARENQ